MVCAAFLPAGGCSEPPGPTALEPGRPVRLEEALEFSAPTISVVEEKRLSSRVAGAPGSSAAQVRRAPSGQSDPVTTTRVKPGGTSWSVPATSEVTTSPFDVRVRSGTGPNGAFGAPLKP